MTAYERWVSVGLPMLLLGSFGLALGLNIAKHKPILIAPKSLGRGISLVFLPMLIISAYRLSVDILNAESVMASLAVSLLTLSMLVGFCAVLVFLSTRSIWLFNVTEAILIEALGEVLQKNGIKYSLSTEPSAKFRGLSRVIVSLSSPESSIEITLMTLGRAWARFRGRRRIPNYDTLISDFRCALRAKEYGGATAAFPFFLAATISVGVAIYGVLLVLLK